MVNKLVVSLILLLMLLGVAIYFRVEFKYAMVANNRNSFILKELNKAAKTKSINDNETQEDKIYAVMEKNGIKFATDFILIEDYLFKACDPNCLNNPSFYKNYSKMIDQIKLKRLWVVKHNQLEDKVAYYIQDQEEQQFVDTFLKRRSYISDHYKNISNLDNKEQALALVKIIDNKIIELKKK